MIRPELRRIAAQVRARLQSGEALTWRDVWAMAPDASRTWAHDTLRKLREKVLAHELCSCIIQIKEARQTAKPAPRGSGARR